MPAEVDVAIILRRIHALASAPADASPAAMRQALQEIASLAERHLGDTPEPSDPPRTENQTL